MKEFTVTTSVKVTARNAKTAAEKGRKLLRSHECPALELKVVDDTDADQVQIFTWTPKTKETPDAQEDQTGTPAAEGEATPSA